MEPERWQEIDKILEAALEQEEPGRSAFLEEACAGDESLRKEVESLLLAHNRAGDFMEEPPQSLIGSQLHSYKILSLLGAGGMGEVYRARDMKLEREVAIKVLPAEFTQDPERLARFQQEAKLLASLNHPNIAAIHGLEESDGIRFLVLELVEGKTLAERVAKRPLPVEEALEVCRQMAEGVEAAHEKGVIHRDLKPANVKVTPEGKVKILDFGLSKAFKGETPVTDISQSPTLIDEMTRAGVILGTAAYMSPEQARGKPVDKRADIFAFGCVLYELLTGKKAFEGETITETLGAIIHKEPDWEGLPSNSPSLVRFLLNRCLQKDVSRRLQHIDGARILIEEALTGETTASAMGLTAAPAPGWKRVMTVALVVVAVITTGISIWSLMKPASPLLTAGSIAEFSITLPLGTHLTNSNGRELAISADGRHTVYRSVNEGRAQLYLRSLDDQEAKAIPGTEGAGPSPSFSPDGESVAFTIGGKLKKVGVTGGAPVTIGDAQADRAGSWGSEDIIVFGSVAGPGGGLYRISASGGEPKPIMIPDPDKGLFVFVDPQILPGGEAVLYGENSNKSWVVSMETGERKMVLEGARSPRYASTGHLVYEMPGTGILMAVAFDLEKLEVTGDPVLVLEGVRRDTFLNATLDYQFSDHGTLIYVPEQTTTEHELVWVDRQGTESLITKERGNYSSPRISPDGKRVAVTLFGGNERSVWIYNLEGDSFRRLTFEGSHGGPTWSPDGRWIVYGSGNLGVLYKHLADGSGLPQKLTEEISRARITDSWSPDGRILSYSQRGSEGDDIWMLPMDGDGKPQFFTRGAFPKFSPDGQWVAYVRLERGQLQVYVSPYSEPGVQWLVSGQEGGAEPVWSPDGTELFYRSGDQMMVVSVQTDPTFNAARPRVLFEGSYLSTAISLGFQYYDISPDGQRFLMIKDAGAGHTQINVVLNWFEELKRLVPID